MNISTEKKIIDLEKRLVAAPGGGGGSGRDQDLRVIGFTMRSCCVALRTMSRYLHRNTTMGGKSMYTCMCNLVPMQYSGKKKKGRNF